MIWSSVNCQNCQLSLCGIRSGIKLALHSPCTFPGVCVAWVSGVKRVATHGRFIAALILFISYAAPLANSQESLSVWEGDDVAKLRVPALLEYPEESNLVNATTPVKTNAFISNSLPKQETGVDWRHLLIGSADFLVLEHSFRYASEDATRYWIGNFSVSGYADSVGSLHGWGDGDPFLVNYVGHPMQGAVSSFMWQHNDRAFRAVEFGRNRQYWKARLRGMAFAYVYSVQFEIGPVSEASLGNIQSRWPQFGFVDHIVTPTIGMGWAVAEDAIDRMVVQRIEPHLPKPWMRVFLRGGLNPARSFANVMDGKVPWHRDDRPGLYKLAPEGSFAAASFVRGIESVPVDPPPGVAPFDFSFNATARQYLGNTDAGTCAGGGGTAGFRLAREWQAMLDVGGCRLFEWRAHWSGDALTYTAGPRWTPDVSQRWIPHLEMLVGGTKVTQEYRDPTREAEAASMPDKNEQEDIAKHNFYTTDWDQAGLAMHVGGGLNLRLNNALELRLANVSYEHSWLDPMHGIQYRNAVQVSGGLVIRMGTW